MGKKVELRFKIPEDYIDSMVRETASDDRAEVTKDALTLYNWAIDEVAKGRAIVSLDPESKEEIHLLAMPSLQRAKEQKRTVAGD